MKRIFQEIVIVGLLGGLPIFTSYWFGGIKLLEETVRALLPSGSQILYAFLLMVPYALLALLEWWVLFRTDLAKKFWRVAVSTLSEVGSGFLGILRASTGVLLFFPLFLFIYDEAFKFASVIHFLLYGLVALFDCICISFAHNWLKRHEPKIL